MSRSRTDHIVIDFAQADDHELHIQLLGQIDLLKLNLNPGDVIPAGNYIIPGTKESPITYKIDLRNNVRMCAVINPETVNDDNVHILELFMQDECVGKYYPVGVNYLSGVDIGSPVKSFSIFELTRAVAVRKTEYGAIVADVINSSNLIGEGSSRQVFAVSGSLKYRYQPAKTLKFELDHDRRVFNVGKVYKYDADETLEDLEKEMSLMKSCPHISVRGGFFSDMSRWEAFSAVSMRKFPGHDLNKLLKGDVVEKYLAKNNLSDNEKEEFISLHSKAKLPAWSLNDRMELSLALLRQLRAQIHARGIVHRDIKPHNIKVSKINNGFVVNIFDFNLSRFSWHQDGRACGTPTYVAPEFDVYGVAELDEKSDVFSMALVLALIWRDVEQGMHFDSSVNINPIEERDNCGWNITFNIGDGILGLDDKMKLALTELLTSMTKRFKDERVDLDTAINMLEDIYLSHKCKAISPDHHVSVYDAVRVARLTRISLANVHYNSMDSFAVKLLCNELKIRIEPLVDNDYVIREFIEVLGVEAFRGITTKSGLLEKANDIANGFEAVALKIKDMRQKLRDLFAVIGTENTLPEEKAYRLRLLSEQVAHLSVCEDKVARSLLTFDCAVAETQRLLKKATNVERALDGFDELKPAVGRFATLN